MKSRLIIHDLSELEAMQLFHSIDSETIVFAVDEDSKVCIGCFNCWIKTPGQCIIKDKIQSLPKLMKDCNEVIIISRLVYGGYSPQIKMALDRNIGYILPYFHIVDGEMHHQMRYNNPFSLQVHFYGDPILEEEKLIAKQLVKGNTINFGSKSYLVDFHESSSLCKEKIL